MRTVCIIPARMASSRFPGKPMEPLLGMPMILHLWHRCRLFQSFDRVAVATCDTVIYDAVVDVGGEAIMTRDTHPGCVDRTEEAIGKLGAPLADDALVLMVQGDEILVNPEMLAGVVEAYGRDRDPVVNLVSKIYRTADHDDPNVVKVVFGSDHRVLYMSRAPIPSRARVVTVPMYQQTGVIGFSAGFLRRFGRLERTPLEMIELIDMLRAIERGYPVRVVTTETETIGVDTKADRDRAEQVLRRDRFTDRYLTTPLQVEASPRSSG